MLKYLYCKEIFQEVPDEITLGISISGCTIHCKNCHSQELWNDVGTDLTTDELHRLITQHNGITCVCFMGGEHDIAYLIELCKSIHDDIKVAWYCGLAKVPEKYNDIFNYLDFVKIGPYIEELGGLTSPKTNQRFYMIKHKDGANEFIDLTNIFYQVYGNT